VGTFCVTGSSSGMGAATVEKLAADSHRVIGVDLNSAEVVADLATPDGRHAAIAAVGKHCDGVLDGLVTFAGVGSSRRVGSSVVCTNYFGTVALLEGLRHLLAESDASSAVAITSNVATCQRGISTELVEALLSGDEVEAAAMADDIGAGGAYACSKMAVARYVRRNAPTSAWIGLGIRLNGIAPGVIDTPMVAEARADPQMKRFVDESKIPVGRFGRADEVAALAAFLLGRDARFVCGSIIWCDGGTDALLRSEDWPTAR
jgi:NAD(P)-dependent dehydrogenase (short-subunit alcohol dehydrogenase family)